jgi:hypothetical protein
LDKQAWKILKVLYPESTTTGGECLQCRAEACQAQKQLADQQEAARLERKLPLQTVRRFYTRTRGVQEHYLRKNQTTTIATTAVASTSKDSFFRSASHELNIHTLLEQDADDDCHDDEDRKLPAKMSPPEADAKIPMNHCQTVALEKSMCPFVEPAPCKRTAHGAAV